MKPVGKPYGLAYRTPEGWIVQMYRHRQAVRWYTVDAFKRYRQVGPIQANVTPALAYALQNGWREATAADLRENARWRHVVEVSANR